MRSILFSAALLITGWCAAQTVTGTVVNNSGETLEGVNISTSSGRSGAVSTSTGSFTLNFTQPGKYVLRFSYVSHESRTENITLSEGENLDLGRIVLTEIQQELEQVNVTATRVKANGPLVYQNLDEETIEDNNTGQDIPYILNQATSVVTTSDAGAGVGYTGMRIRGSDQTRINVTINGIPVNDAESHGVFWVNTPDLASSTSSIQIQRGVGTSTNGSGSFGANINLQTDELSRTSYAKAHLGYGSFDTERATLEVGSGLLNGHWVFQGRLSQIRSEGYIDRARSNLRSYFMSGGYIGDNFSIKAVVFGGNEETYQAWYGLDSATYFAAVDKGEEPTYNYAGEVYDDNFNLTGYYDDQVDHYTQNHYQLHYNQVLSKSTSLNLSAHYTKGSGYYEEYQNSDSLATYGITSTPQVYGDVVRRLWLDNDFYGVVGNIDYQKNKLNLIVGGGANYYDGIHFGELVWARYAGNTQPYDRFYLSYGDKTDANVYTKLYYDFTSKLQAFVDLQYRLVNLSGNGDDENNRQIDFSGEFHFFNPKAGISYTFNNAVMAYASYAIANREPNRQDFIENEETPKAEKLNDLEAGARFKLGRLNLNVNYFLMQYRDQLVLTGQLNNVGYPIRRNVGESFRTGVEIEAQASFLNNTLVWMPNLTLSTHQNRDYIGDDLTNYGNTPIAYSPNLIGGSVLKYTGVKNFEIALQNKYVGEQYLDNTGNERYLLPSYFLTDLRLAYKLRILNMERCQLQLSVYNLTNERYISNGYVYGTPYYYAQAGINYMAGLRIEL